MGTAAAARIRLEVEEAIGIVCLDAWLLGTLRDGRLRVLAASDHGVERPYRSFLALTPEARWCLHRRRPAALARERADGCAGRELGCRTVVYAPVGLPGRRPVGLLVAGRREPRRFIPEEADYLAAVAVALTPAVLAHDSPLARLTELERSTARLVGQGLSVPEIATALDLERLMARDLVGGIMKKLALRSPRQLSELWPDGSFH